MAGYRMASLQVDNKEWRYMPTLRKSKIGSNDTKSNTRLNQKWIFLLLDKSFYRDKKTPRTRKSLQNGTRPTYKIKGKKAKA